MRITIYLLLFIYSIGFSITGDDIIENVEDKLKDLDNMSAKFKQVQYLDLSGEEITSEGMVYMKDGKKFRYELDGDFIISDGKTVKRYSKANNQLLIENIKEDETTALPTHIIFDFSKNYELKDFIEKTENGKEYYVLFLESRKGEERFIHKVNVFVTEDYLIKKTETEDIDGNKTLYILSDIDIESNISEDKFKANLPESVEVIDLRE